MSVPRTQQVDDAEYAPLVGAARTGDNDAWTCLIARYERTLRGIVRSYRLQPSDVDDVVQITWMRSYQHINRLRDPTAIAGWLATTARREALRVLQAHVREDLSDDPELGNAPESDGAEEQVLAAEDRVVLGRAIAALPDRQRDLMNLLAMEPDANYQQISETLGMPVGSIGPTRARGLGRLRRDRELHSHHLDRAFSMELDHQSVSASYG